MAEDESDQESERLIEELEAIIDQELRGLRERLDRSRHYCRRFCQVVEDYTARWHVPLPQLQVLQTALCCFTSASVSFPDECEHVQYVLSRLALSLFELLLFFGKDEFYEAPLKDILGSVQECHDLLFRYDNSDLRLVTCVIKDGGPWEDPVLQAVLKGKSEPEEIVEKYLSSENPLFFEFRVRYLIACERISEAVALITTCLSHSELSKNYYYHQAYFTCLYMTKLTEKLLPEHVLRVDPSDGVKIICNIEKEGKTVLALQLSEAFLLTQLQTGKMDCLWDLIFIWSKLQLKMNPSKEDFIEQCYSMLRIAANVKVIFPFMKTIRNEIGEAAVQLSVELCGCALQLDLHDSPEAKSLIYKTLAYLFPKDLEICRICALSVFFLEQTVEAYRDVERLYKCRDEDYNEFNSYVENRVRFELLPILKRGLLFDPEFWSFQMIQQNCAEMLGDEAHIALSAPEPPEVMVEDVVEQSLPVKDVPVQLYRPPVKKRNGLLKHKESSSKLKQRLTFNSRKSNFVQIPYRMEHYVPRHSCLLCNREFLGGHILRHAQRHTEGGGFTCVICGRKFRNKLVMLRHLKHHLKKVQRQPLTVPSEASCVRDVNDGSSLESAISHALDNGLSENSSSEGLKAVSNQDPTVSNQDPTSSSQDASNGQLLTGENHLTDHNKEHLSDTIANPTSASTEAGNTVEVAIAIVETDAKEEKTDAVKLNGAVLSKGKPVDDPQIKHCCPAQGCNRSYQRVMSLNKHVRRVHPLDVRVQQYIMAYNKSKCRFCHIKFSNGRHFIEHLNRHIYPNVHFCHHTNCNERFRTLAELAVHKSSHEFFRFQCSFNNCTEVFEQISSLYEHEAQHYKQNPEEASAILPNDEPLCPVRLKQIRKKDAADKPPTLFRKIKKPAQKPETELPVPTWKSRKPAAKPKTYKQNEKKLNGEVPTPEQPPETCSNTLETAPGKDIVEEMPLAIVEEQSPPCDQVTEQTEVDPSILTEHTTESAPNPSTPNTGEETEETSSTPNSNNAPKLNQPLGVRSVSNHYVRPPPSAYLDEQYLSMPKRRHQEPSTVLHTAPQLPSEKIRCTKCLTNYSSSEALEEHLAQKKCQLYFGFDSDDESAW